MTKTEIPEGLMTKLANLKVLSERGATLGEIQAATLAFQKLLSKYNLSAEDIDDQDENLKIGEIQGEFPDASGRGAAAKQMLLSGIAKANYAKIILNRSGNSVTAFTRYTLIGSKGSLIQIQTMFEYLWQTIKREANQRKRQYNWTASHWTSFVRGAVIELYARLNAMRNEAEQETNNSTALVLVKDAKLKNYVAENHANITAGRAITRLRDASTYGAGRQFGKSIGLNSQIGHANQKKIV